MKHLALISLIVLSACAANRPAPSNPNSVPNVMLSMTEARQAGPHIFITGGIYDGAAAGQTASFVVTPDDRVICTFQTDPVPFGGTTEIVRTAHRLTQAGIYNALSAIFVPNVEPVGVTFTTNFSVETGGPVGTVTTSTGFNDPRFERLMDVFQSTPTPCWAFG